jgi:hypothetical protein
MVTSAKRSSTPKPTGRTLEQVQAPASPEQAPASPAPKAKRDRSSLYAKYTPVDTHVITVVPGCKGKRNGTKAGSRWAILAQNSGKTVAEVRAAYEAAKLDPKRLRNDLRWNLAHNLVTVA